MYDTPKLSLPHLQPAQALKHVTINESLQRLDGIVQLNIEGEIPVPDPHAVLGATYFVSTDASGVFEGHAGQIAIYGSGGYVFVTPQEGWLCWNATEVVHQTYRDGMWVDLASTNTSPDRLSINSSLDPNNRFSIKADSSLFDAETGPHHLVLNRKTAENDGSLIFQTDYVGQAQFGLIAGGDLALRVSQDGMAWEDAMLITPTGKVTFPKASTHRVERTVLTHGAGQFDVPDGAIGLQVSACGGGGAGAENPNTNVLAGAGGGGGAGFVQAFIPAASLSQTYQYTIGEAGQGGLAAPGDPVGARDGENGGSTVFSGSGIQISAGGGAGAPEKEARAGHNEYVGGGGGHARGGDVNISGGTGGGGLTVMTEYFMLGHGHGGGSHWGHGGSFVNGNGQAGVGYGGGGSGACMIPRFVLNRSGGAGAQGLLIIDAYF